MAEREAQRFNEEVCEPRKDSLKKRGEPIHARSRFREARAKRREVEMAE